MGIWDFMWVAFEKFGFTAAGTRSIITHENVKKWWDSLGVLHTHQDLLFSISFAFITAHLS